MAAPRGMPAMACRRPIAAQLVGGLEGLDLEAKINALGGFELTGRFGGRPVLHLSH